MSQTKAAETMRPALVRRARFAGTLPEEIPAPEPDMRITDPKKRAKAFAKASRNIEHANNAAMSKALASARDPWFGCAAGRAIATTPDLRRILADRSLDVPTLWDTIQRIRGVYARYWHAIGAPSPYAAGMNLELLPEEFGSDGVEIDGDWDDRSEEEKVRSATGAMMHMEGVLGRAGNGVASEVKSVVLGDEPVRHMARFLAGLAAVAKEA
ncbi:MAG: hypothetical protein U1E59_20315 [Amaricoccus sp.]